MFASDKFTCMNAAFMQLPQTTFTEYTVGYSLIKYCCCNDHKIYRWYSNHSKGKQNIKYIVLNQPTVKSRLKVEIEIKIEVERNKLHKLNT